MTTITAEPIILEVDSNVDTTDTSETLPHESEHDAVDTTSVDDELRDCLLQYSLVIGSAGPDVRLRKQCERISPEYYIDDDSTSDWLELLTKTQRKKLRRWLKVQLRKGRDGKESSNINGRKAKSTELKKRRIRMKPRKKWGKALY